MRWSVLSAKPGFAPISWIKIDSTVSLLFTVLFKIINLNLLFVHMGNKIKFKGGLYGLSWSNQVV